MASIDHSHRWFGTTHSQIPQQQLCWKKNPDRCQPVKHTFNKKHLRHKAGFKVLRYTDHYINLGCLEIPFRKQHRPHPMSSPCHKPHFKNIATNPAIDRIKRFRSSLCGCPVPNTKCPWTPGVTKMGRWQQRSLERNHVKRTNPRHPRRFQYIPFISYLVTLFLPLFIKVSTHTSSYRYNIRALIMLTNLSHDDKCHFEDLLYLLSFPSVRIYNQGEHSNTR